MGRTHNPDNRYAFTCKVTGETVKTNPRQFAKLAERYDITPEQLDTSYISCKGRRVVADAKMTPEAVVSTYGVHINVAQNLKCTAKPSVPKTRKPRTPKSKIPVAVAPVEIPVVENIQEDKIEENVDNEPEAEYAAPEVQDLLELARN
jgi:hypothetical protein